MTDNMRSIAAYYSEAMTQTQQDATQCTRPMTVEENEAFRAFYLEAMGPWEQNKQHSDRVVRREGWNQTRAHFATVIAEIEHCLRANGDFLDGEKRRTGTRTRTTTTTTETLAVDIVEDGGSEVHSTRATPSIVFRISDKTYTFGGGHNGGDGGDGRDGRDGRDEAIGITLGRIEFNDIVLAQHGASRLHAIVRRFGDQLVFMDVGSCFGIELRERSNEAAPCEASRPGDRRPLIIGADEHAVFALGPSVTLTVNPKDCVILGSQCTGVRNFRGQCGHFISCGECAEEWRTHGGAQGALCPECREPFFGVRAAFGVEHVMTHVPTITFAPTTTTTTTTTMTMMTTTNSVP